MSENTFTAEFSLGLKVYSIPCESIYKFEGCTIIEGIPSDCGIGYSIILASVPSNVFVQIVPKI